MCSSVKLICQEISLLLHAGITIGCVIKSWRRIYAWQMQDFGACVPLAPDNVLWQISGFLNSLWARVQRLREEAAQLQRPNSTIQQAHEENRKLKRILKNNIG